jgi:4-azaleucine resistance transporter AzlC|tara:strand:- start:508 stop:1200 length:693 start_codon:yes stop_codon:yes gene_type:complete
MSSKSDIFKKGSIDIAPHLLSVVPFGIIFGAIGIELGFDPYLTYATSLIIFGGASQIVFVQLLSGGASSLIAITSVGVVNSRHLLYGAVLSQYLEKLNLIKKLIYSYFITDQGFAVSNIYLNENKNQKFNHYHIIGAGITLWISWQISTIAGIILGSIIPDELGLKFAIPLTFIAIIVQDLRKLDHVLVMIVSGVSAVILYNIPFKSYIIVAPLIGLLASSVILKFKLIK